MEPIFGMVSLLFSLLPLAVIALVAVTLVRAAARARQTDQRPPATKARIRLDPASRTIRQVVDELAELRRKNEAHERHLLARVHRD